MKISKIKIGKRHRLDLGDIKSLAASIKAVGLLHPVVIRPDGRLIAGERRMAAFKSLGRTEIPATVVDIKSIVLGEAAENFDRKDFTLSEAVAIKREIEPEIKAEAKERMLAGKPCGKLPPGVKGKARDEVAKFTGVKPRTLEKAEAVVKAAEDNPAKFGKLKDEMDRTGRVDGAFKRLKVARQAAAIKAEAPPLPNQGPYRVIVVDPPWPYEVRQEDPSHRAVHPYPLMSIKQIC